MVNATVVKWSLKRFTFFGIVNTIVVKWGPKRFTIATALSDQTWNSKGTLCTNIISSTVDPQKVIVALQNPLQTFPSVSITFVPPDLENKAHQNPCISHPAQHLRPPKNRLTTCPPISIRRQPQQKLHNSQRRRAYQSYTGDFRVWTLPRPPSNCRGRRWCAVAGGARGLK